MEPEDPKRRWDDRRLGWVDPDMAGTYDRVRFEGRASALKQRADARAVLGALATIGPGLDLLDAPAGTGRMTADLQAAGHRVVGVDLSEAMVRAGRGAGVPPLTALGEIEALPFADGSFDAVVSMRFLFHARDPEVRRRLLGEFARVARFVVVHERFAPTLKDTSRRLRARMRLSRPRPPAPTTASLRAELAGAGLELVRVRRISALFSDKVVFLARSVR